MHMSMHMSIHISIHVFTHLPIHMPMPMLMHMPICMPMHMPHAACLLQGSGGTNTACLAAYAVTEQWKCLMAQYIVPHLRTPIYVMNSAYDAWQVSMHARTHARTHASAGVHVGLCHDLGLQCRSKVLLRDIVTVAS